MPWFKIDDGFWSHPKVLELSPEAVALWVRAGSYCAGHLTDGEVKPSILRLMGANDAQAKELVDSGLWDFAGGSWWFHDWAEYQPSASATKEKRAALSAERSKAGAKGAAKRWQKDGNSDGKLPSVSHEGVDGKPIAPSRPVPNPSPDLSKTSKSQSLDNRARVSTDVSPIIERLADQHGITDLGKIAACVLEHTGRELSADEAWQVANSILQNAREFPDSPMRYVTAAIVRSPFEVQQFIDREVAA